MRKSAFGCTKSRRAVSAYPKPPGEQSSRHAPRAGGFGTRSVPTTFAAGPPGRRVVRSLPQHARGQHGDDVVAHLGEAALDAHLLDGVVERQAQFALAEPADQ